MDKIKDFLTGFFLAEAEARTNWDRPDLQEYNASVERMYSFVDDVMHERLGVTFHDELDNDEYYEDVKNVPPQNPRHLFKISRYTHKKYGDVWVAYVSMTNPDDDWKSLSTALMIIKVDSKLRIAREYIYSNYNSDGYCYQWEAGEGYNDLIFEKLEGPHQIERYQEPVDYLDGLEHYHSNI